MMRFLLGVVVGTYISQNYKIPNIKHSVKYLQSSLEEYEATLSKKEEKE